MATNNTSKNQCQGPQTITLQSHQPQHSQIQQSQNLNYEPLDKSSSTLKRNPKMEFSKADLLKLLSYLEGELQARDVVIATLKCEKVKQLLSGGARWRGAEGAAAALGRDAFAAVAPHGGSEAQACGLAERQLGSLEQLVLQQRRGQLRVARLLKDAEGRHRKVVQELVEEKRKHEHDTAQGDDITYGLEKERTRLKQELEMERQAKKRLEKELKKLTETAEEEKNRQKQIVLLLLAERKKIIMKYVEERKRSEDLAQILTEEKGRMDSMAEGLEEESKKSLRMEAELEKQLSHFNMESQQLKASILKEEKRCKDLECEVASLEKQLAEAHQVAMFQASAALLPTSHATVPLPPGSVGVAVGVGVAEVGAAGTPMMSVAKVVQPTATVSSVPVCAPTTGIARSVSPGQSLRAASSSSSSSPSLPQEVDKPKGGASRLTYGAGAAVGRGGTVGAVGRGAPPPVPPNKPVVPPKKDTLLGPRSRAEPSDDKPTPTETLLKAAEQVRLASS